MPVPTSISELSTTPGLNSPAGSDAPSVLDDHARTAYAFIKTLDNDKAADSAAVKLTGDQTIAGVKTFSSTIVGSVNGNAATATSATTAGNVTGTVAIANGGTGQTTAGAARTALSAVGLTGNETVAGVKTLSSAPILSAGATFGSATLANVATSAPLFGARAFGVFDGRTTGTFAPNNAGNVASITRTTAGTYTVTMTTALGSTDYIVIPTCRNTTVSVYATAVNESNTTTTFVITTKQEGGGLVDCAYVSFVVYRT